MLRPGPAAQQCSFSVPHPPFPQLFCEELRPTLVAENPKASMPELSRLLASAWRATSVEDKAAYAAMRAVSACRDAERICGCACH